jgi:hypothetical protein
MLSAAAPLLVTTAFSDRWCFQRNKALPGLPQRQARFRR